MTNTCDIAIIGGGPVGLALALALKENGLDVRLLEARGIEAAAADPRALALAYGSRLLLDRLGVWRNVSSVANIRTIHVSQKQSFGRSLLRAAEQQVPELGYVLPYPVLHSAMQRALQAESNITYLTGAQVESLTPGHATAEIVYRHAETIHTLHAKLAVVADGGRLLETSHPPELHDYGQSAVIAHVTCTHPQPDTAFERFTEQGPVALLPYRGGYELVWTAPHETAQDMVQWEENRFLNALHAHFGDRVGRFTSVGTRSCYPLRLKRAGQLTLPHAVLIGNAAQTLHPVAGQGFNMGLRDAWELAQTILDHAPGDIGSERMLAAYHNSRQADRSAGIRFTDGLVRLFSNNMPVIGEVRALSLSALDCLPPLKRFVAKRMMFGANG